MEYLLFHIESNIENNIESRADTGGSKNQDRKVNRKNFTRKNLGKSRLPRSKIAVESCVQIPFLATTFAKSIFFD